MKPTLTILSSVALLLTGAVIANGQSFNVNLSAKHISQIEKFKNPAKKLKKYKKYYSKDSVRFIKAWERRLRKKPDSILEATQASIRQSEQRIQLAERGLMSKMSGVLSNANLGKVGVNLNKAGASPDKVGVNTLNDQLLKKPDGILNATQGNIRQSEQGVQHLEQGLNNKVSGALSGVSPNLAGASLDKIRVNPDNIGVNPNRVGASSLDERVLAQSFNPEPFKNEAEVFYGGHYAWRRDLGRWYLSSGYYKPDSTGINMESLTGKLGLSQSVPAGLPNLPQTTQGMPSIDGQVNALKGKGKSEALSQLNGIKGVKEAKETKGDVGKYSGELSKYKNQYGKYAQNPDSLKTFALRDGSRLAEREMESRMSAFGSMKDFKNYQKELSQVKGLQNQYKGQIDQLKDSAYLKKKAKEKAEEMAMTYLQEHPEIMNAVQKKMNTLMRKYSIVPNSNDLSTATKRSSLKGKSLTERLVVAANFQMLSFRPLSIDLAPMLGYKVNRLLSIGIGGMYRKTFTDSIPTLAPQIIGYKGFTSYEVTRNFFGYAEFGSNSPGLKVLEGRTTRIWKNAFIAGVGKRMLIHKNIEMTMLVGYNFFYQPHDPVYPRPLIVRVGFQLSELALLKRRLALPR